MAGSPEAPTVLIMAAGEGTRMRSSIPKVLHEVCGRPMVAWPILAAREAGAGRVAVIVGPKHDISSALPDGTETITQPEANGTGGAMRAAIDVISESKEVVVLSGDHPLLSAEIIAELLETHRSEDAAATVMTVELDDPGQYGRIVRDSDGGVERIVETKHPESVPPEILATKEINTGTYCFSGAEFAAALERITDDNDAGEYYLGDVLPLLRDDGMKLAAYVATDPNVNLGVNTRADLAVVATEARRKIAERHLLAGVAITDPASTWIDADVEIAEDAVIEPGSALRGATRIGSNATIGPHTTILDSEIGEGANILRSHLDQANVGANCNVGPFTYLRPGANLASGSKAGAFVEIKNSEIGQGAKVPHLAYVGDTDIGAGANLGAGSITANYDGQNKHRTKIGEGARVGVNNSLVAPVEVGEGAYTGAGAVIRSDVPPGSLGVTDADQRNIEDYAKRKMSDTEGGEEVTTTETAEVASDRDAVMGSIMTVADEMPRSLSSIPHDYTKSLMVFGGRASTEQAARIADKLDLDLGRVTLKTFADGEVYCRYEESIRGADIFIVQSTAKNIAEGMTPNDSLMELLTMIDAAKGASAHRIIAVMPWYGYSRQDKKSAPREPITARVVAQCLEAVGVDRILTMDLHSGQVQGFFSKPVDHMTAMPMLTQYFIDQHLGDDLVIVSPDAGRVKVARNFARKVGVHWAVMEKERPAHNTADIGYVVGDVQGKTAVLVDDMIDTAGTLCAAAKTVLDEGAARVIACATHGVFSGPAYERLAYENSGIEQIVVTDTVPLAPGAPDNITVLHASQILADSIRRIFADDSVSEIFAGENQLF